MKKLKIPSEANIAIVYRPDTAPALALAKALSKWLKEKNLKVFTAPEQTLIQGTTSLKSRAELKKMDLIVALGGDGTYLRAIRLLEKKVVPILGVNLGSLGFLTPFKADEVFSAVELALKNKLELRPRAVIDLQLLRKNRTVLHLQALNDVVLERGSFSQLINLSIHAGKEFVSEVKADGIILATPTGSTAYNLSAGGPILHPETSCFVVTPIAPHSLASRPLIFPDNIKIHLKLLSKPQLKSKAHLVVDGFKVEAITEHDEIIISQASEKHLMVRDPQQTFFHLLREKLKFGDR